jgi:predicted P-type ATPase
MIARYTYTFPAVNAALLSSLVISGAALEEKRGVPGPNGSIIPTNAVSIGILAPGYIATYSVGVVILLAHLVHMVRRSMVFRSIPNAHSSIKAERVIEHGFRHSQIGRAIRWSLLLFVVWLQVAIILSIVGHYGGVWIFDPSVPKGAVDWDSYTRVFLMAWSASILIGITCRVFREQLRTFYMVPVALDAAVVVQLNQILVDSSDSKGELAVSHQEVLPVQVDQGRYVEFLLRRYVWSETAKMFVRHTTFSEAGPTGSEADAILRVGGLSADFAANRKTQVGRNVIVFNLPSFFRMTVNEFSSFFYIYQISSCWLPFYWDYVTVGFLTLTLVLASAMIKIRMEHKQKRMLKDMATLHGMVWAKRDNVWTEVKSEELVPGDLVCLTASSERHTKEIVADCILVSGHAIVDEAALSGETMPVQKFTVPVSDQHRNPEDAESKKYFLFAGTTLLQTGGALGPSGVSDGSLAIVISTGASTLRGSMMRGLLFGASLKSRLFSELRVSVAILIVLALIDFFSLSSNFQMSMGAMLTAMYSIIGLINPLMAVSLVAGELQSAKRLKNNKEHKVHTRDLHRLTVAGKTSMALLDKTGTITKSGLDFYGVVPADTLRLTDCNNRHSDIHPDLSAALALTHTVSVCNKQIIGHQVELRMVETAQNLGWLYEGDLRSAAAPDEKRWKVEKLFPFSHETMTMSVVVSQHGASSTVICKGSFEALKDRCTGMAAQAGEIADKYAKDGCYVLAVGMKAVKADQAPHEVAREEVESDLRFIGLILFRNELKEDSKEAIGELQAAGIAVKMMTGDSVYTGAAVAKMVGIIPADSRVIIGTISPRTRWVEWKLADTGMVVSHESLNIDSSVSLCITGEVFALLSANGQLNLDATKVYGRVSPNQKAEIVKLYTSQGHVVTMAGDGANDSCALKASAAGLALSGRTEASISAPFSTDSDSLKSLTLLMREARAALCTSLASYQSLVVVGILYCISKSILLFQAEAYQAGLAYLYLDLITTPLMLVGVCSSLAGKKLAAESPEGSLLGGQLVISCIWSIVICIAFLGLADLVMVNQDWFVPFKADPNIGLEEWQKRGNNFEAALIFIWCAWVYIDVPLAFSRGGLHRAPIYTNWRLMLAAAALFATTLAILFVQSSEFGCYFKVACGVHDSLETSKAFINNFLFPYEKVGGTWWNVDIESTEFPVSFKIGLFFILLSMSIVHHVGHHLIQIKLKTWIHDKLKWDGNFVRRRRRTAAKEVPAPLKTEVTTSTLVGAMDESMKTSLR